MNDSLEEIIKLLDYCRETGMTQGEQQRIEDFLEEQEKKNRRLKELFFLLKKDHETLENFQTNDWMVKARGMGIDV